MPNQTKKKDLVIVGGGAGGLALAFRAARLGLKVGVVDKYPLLGGDYLHLGCVPSKALLAVAQTAHDFTQAHKQGLPNQVSIDWPGIKANLNQIRQDIQPRYSQEKLESLWGDVCTGEPVFVGPNTLSILDKTLQLKQEWIAKKIVIATGSRPMILPIPGLSSSEVHTNETIYQLSALPKSMVIVGAGVTGIEFAQAFQRLGVKVTVLVHSGRILRTLDIQGSTAISDVLKQEGVSILTEANIIQASRKDPQTINLVIQQKEKTFNLETETVFVATGRLPNIENLGLEQIGMQYTKQGIVVDDYFRTNLKHIYAIGDVIAWPHRFAHMAEYGAEVVYRHLYLKNLAPKAKLKWVPGVIFTSPEMASLGLTEQEAQAQKLVYEILYWEFKNLDRAAISNKPEGFIKLILVKQKVIGATVVCERAGEILAELGILMQKNRSISDVIETIHAYPTWAEGLRRAVQTHFDQNNKPSLRCWPSWLTSWLKRLMQRTLSKL